jgi:CheY-like chemotaxis protein
VESTDSAANLVRCVESAIRLTAHQFNHRATVCTRFGATPRVNADEGRLEQVLVNLLVNAAHAIEPGDVARNRVVLVTDSDENGDAIIEVSDTGAGISADVADRIFEPFFTTKPPGLGTGLGLSICHGIVQSMGGGIVVRSEPGKGTTFRITLPRAMERPVAAAAVPVPMAEAPASGRLLVIDDEDMLRRAMERILRDAGYDVTGTASARVALEDIKSGAMFDVILCDLMMPDMTGMQFFEKLLSVSPSLARRVVFVSGGATTAQVGAFLGSVANEKIDKPFRSAQLREVIQRVLREQRG